MSSILLPVDVGEGKELEESGEWLVAGEFFDEIVFAVKGAAVDGGVVEAEAFVAGMGRHGAESAVGEFKGAKVVGCVWSFCHIRCSRRMYSNQIKC